MPQNVKTNGFESPEYNASSAAIVAPQASVAIVASDAERLMDEIFEDVERILNHSPALPPDTEAWATVSTPALSLSHPSTPSMLVHQPTQHLDDDAPTSEENLLAVGVDLPTEAPALESQKGSQVQWQQLLERSLLILSCAAVLAANAVGFALHNRLSQSLPVAVTPTGVQSTAADQEFLGYMQRSLEVLDRKAAVNRQTTAVATVPPAAGAPPVGSANLPPVPVPSSSQAGATVLERVYIPVYQPPQVTAAVPGVPLQVAPGSAVTVPTAPRAVLPPTVAQVPNIAPVSNYSLIGILELGDRSAALFEVNGNPQRVQMGEAIGTSGWTLVAVKNQEAIVRRNGEVRSINIGQRF